MHIFSLHSRPKTHDLAKYGSFSDFQSAHIQQILKSCYVKDLLKILHDKNKTAFEFSGQDIFPNIGEAINRRNIHIHHDGIVDTMYVSEFNIFSESLGSYLQIGKDYLESVLAITKQIINSLAITY